MSVTHDIFLLIARILIALLFVASALDKFKLVPAELQQIASLGLPAPALISRLTGVFEVLGAMSLVLGIYAQIAAVALTMFMAFVTFFFVRFWSFDGPGDMRAMLRNVFFGNLALIGGLVYVAVVGPGGLSLVAFHG